MFFQRCAGAFGVAVEFEKSFGQTAVVQAVAGEHGGGHFLVFSFGKEAVYIFSVDVFAGFVQILAEGCVVQSFKIYFLEIGCRPVVTGVQEGEHVLEHAAGGTGGRHELDDMMVFRGVAFPVFEVFLLFLSGEGEDSFFGAGCRAQAEVWKAVDEL